MAHLSIGYKFGKLFELHVGIAAPIMPIMGHSCDHTPIQIPSGKHTKNYGQSQFSIGESTINGHFQ